MKRSNLDRMAHPTLDRAVTEVLESAPEAESPAEKLARAARYYPPPTAACKACRLQGAEAQVKAIKSGSLEPVEPTSGDHSHNRTEFYAGRDAVLEMMTE